jgi:hypothetical protein
VGGLAIYLEEEGLATTGISLIRLHTEKTNPPRALWVPFELGRPFGVPNDPAFQRRVVLAALALLDARSGPLIVDYPEEVPPEAISEDDITGLSCPIELHGCPARFVLEGVHGIDSTRVPEVCESLDTRKDQSRAAPEYRLSRRSKACSVGAVRYACGRIRGGR